MHDLLHDIGITVLAAALLGVASHLLKQPLLLALVAAGVIIGPTLGLGFVHSGESIEVISELGLILLLFVVGLETNLKELKRSGKELLLPALGQFPICLALGFGIFALLSALNVMPEGSTLQNVYLAIMCALSSTAIVVKVLHDRKDLSTLPGRLTLGVLVLQDLYAIFVLALQPNLANPSLFPILIALGSTVLLVSASFLFAKYGLSALYRAVSMSPEIVISISLGWCAACAGAAEALGLSKEMGALVAGATISAFPYSTHVAARVLPLRDFFLTLFFVSLGMKIEAPTLSMVVPILVMGAVVVLTRFASIYPLVRYSRSGARAAFLTTLNLSQISEFSLVIATLGLASGHISEFTMSLTVYSMVVMAIISSHAIKESDRLLNLFWRLTGGKGAGYTDIDEHRGSGHGKELVILGFHRGASAFLRSVGEQRPELLQRVVVVDFNPRRIEQLKREGIEAVFGDIGNFEILRHVGLEESRIIVSIVPDMLLRGTSNSAIVRMTRALSPRAIIVATADDETHARELTREGAQIVLSPFDLAGGAMIDQLNSLFSNATAVPGVTETLARRWTLEEREILFKGLKKTAGE